MEAGTGGTSGGRENGVIDDNYWSLRGALRGGTSRGHFPGATAISHGNPGVARVSSRTQEGR